MRSMRQLQLAFRDAKRKAAGARALGGLWVQDIGGLLVETGPPSGLKGGKQPARLDQYKRNVAKLRAELHQKEES